MRVKTPQSLVTFPKNDEVVVYNYLTKDAVSCSPSDLYWMMLASQWRSIDEILSDHPDIDPDSLRREFMRMVDAGVMLEEGSDKAVAEQSYTKSWDLGMAAGLFHFAALDNKFVSASEATAIQKEKASIGPSPELYWKNSGNAIQLPDCGGCNASPLFEVMQRRRTLRAVKPTQISLQALTECLYAGLGITGFVQTETATLPLKMTPSGGARNPFEAFVWVRNVESLDPGIYHYSAMEHSLQYVAHCPNAPPQSFVQNQEWADQMPVIIFLVAVLERVTWKYNDPNAYRVVMIEAGHIAQNIMLAGTDNNLSACPTAALNHTEISTLLNLKEITQTPIYAILIGEPEPNPDRILSKQEIDG